MENLTLSQGKNAQKLGITIAKIDDNIFEISSEETIRRIFTDKAQEKRLLTAYKLNILGAFRSVKELVNLALFDSYEEPIIPEII